ncbi:unnamed protein product [Closterium sp. Yama58-4]|nr:unnamed protein product [Closterium sp. Yama58-4]
MLCVTSHISHFLSNRMFTDCAKSFVEDEFCPLCESQVVELHQADNALRTILYFNNNTKNVFKLPTVVNYYCTKGHVYGIFRTTDRPYPPMEGVVPIESPVHLWLEAGAEIDRRKLLYRVLDVWRKEPEVGQVVIEVIFSTNLLPAWFVVVWWLL